MLSAGAMPSIYLVRHGRGHGCGSAKPHCSPFLINGKQVGVVSPDVKAQLKKFPAVFDVTEGQNGKGTVALSPTLKTYEERTRKVHEVMETLREQNLFSALTGWRNEKYRVSESYQAEPLMALERSATSLLGVVQYGVHINGYCKHPDKGVCLWIARRSPTKQTFPGKLDNISAGGLPAGVKVFECLVKECAEEACIPESIARQAVPTGTISYCYMDERGISPEIEFVYDLELPLDFQPKIGDGEVSEFYFWTLEEVKEKIASDEFKPNSAVVTLSFLIRRGFINPDTEPYYQLFIEGMHRSMHF
ncbi:uncharacterized protein [Ptychodera flava]|uniref:uncharacterized protein isoform X2 n=1 Tax=Ptychodera flava TaxID=63121 RepID=UPI003969FC0F